MFFVPYSGMDKVGVAGFPMSRMMLITFFAALMTVFGRIDNVQGALVIDIGVAKNVVNKVYGNTLSKGLRSGDRLFQNQRIRTRRDSGMDIRFLDSSVLYVGELSDLTLDNMIYDINEKAVTGALHIAKGIMRYASGSVANMDVSVKTPDGTIGIRGTAFDVMASSGGTELAVHEGAVQVDLPSGSKQVNAGQVYRISSTGEAGFEKSISEQMRKSVSKMLRMVEGSETASSKATVKKQNLKERANLPLKQSPDEKNATIGKNLDNLLYLALTYGRVIIEMLPRIAPNHVKRIKELVRKKFFDGQIFHNVVAGFAAETGDPTGTGRGGSGTKLKAEISRIPFIRGIVGMKRDRNNLHSADSQFFILLGDATHLEGQYTAWGRVIHGMQLMDRMHKGSPPMDPDRIVRMWVAADTDK